MNKIALRIGIYRHWNHLYYQGLSYVDPRYPLPYWDAMRRDQSALRVLKGFYPLSKIEIHKTREVIDIYICRDRYVNSAPARLTAAPARPGGILGGAEGSSNLTSFPESPFGADAAPVRALLNIFKARVQIFNLYTFPIHEAELLVGYLLRDQGGQPGQSSSLKNKARLNAFRRLWKMGVIVGVKIKIQGRYKKSTRAQNEAYQFGQIPNTPTTKLRIKLFYASRVLLQSLGTSSLHIYIVYGTAGKAPHRPGARVRGTGRAPTRETAGP